MGIAPVGSLQAVAAYGAQQRSVASHAIGNLWLVATLSSGGPAVQGMSGGNAIGWTRVAGPYTVAGETQEIWAGVIAAVGSTDPIRTSYSSDVSAVYMEIDAQEFTAGLGSATAWTAYNWAQLLNGSSSSMTYPRIVPPAGGGYLYFGHASALGSVTPTGGTTPGYTYAADAANDQVAYNPSVSTTQQPVGTLNTAVASATIAVVVGAAGPSPGTVLAGATLVGLGTLTATATATSPPTANTATFVATSRLVAVAGVAAPPPPPGSEPPPPGGGLPPGPPPINPPTTAGLTLYGELAHLAVGDADFGYPLRTYADAAAGHLIQAIDDLVRDTPAGPGWSQAIDVTRAPTYVLPWLGQFVGVRVDPSKLDAVQRAQIVAEAGFGRGTLAAVQAAAQSKLKTGQTATITERSPDAYHFLVTVATADALVKAYADLSVSYATYTLLGGAAATYDSFVPNTAPIVAAVTAAKPAGLQFVMVVAAGASLSGGGSLVATARATTTATRTFVGAGALSAAGVVLVTNAGATLVAVSMFDPGGLLVPESATFAAAGTLATVDKVTAPETATLSGGGSLNAAAATSGPPQLVASYFVPSTASDQSTLTTPPFTPAPGEVIVVKATTQDAATTIGAISGGGQTYVSRINLAAASNDNTELFTAVVGASPSAMAVAVAFGGSSGWHSMVVERWSNAALAASPALGSSQSNTSAAQSLTTTQKNSVVSWVSSDWNVINPGTPVYRGAGAVQDGLHYQTAGGGYTAYFGYQPAAAAGVQTFGVSSPTGQKASLAGIEIQSLTP